METLLTCSVLAAALGSALNAGIFFTFSNTVMRVLFAMPVPVQGPIAMRRINRVIINPGFMGVFLGTASLCLAVLVGSFVAQVPPLASSGAAIYLVGAFGVTGAGNVPLNNALEATEPGTADAAAVWHQFETRWMVYNHVRAAACLLAAVCLAASRL